MMTHLTASPADAARYLRAGELVAFPTETVYGLGADALQPDAVARIYEAKGRPSDNPLIVHVADRPAIMRVASAINEPAERLLDTFAPGPLTLVLPRRTDLPANVSAGLATVAVRIPRHAVARAFLERCDTPVAAPSANRSGRPSPTDWQAVREDLGGRIACILTGLRSEVGLESTVVDCTSDVPVLLRAGAVTLGELRTVVPGIILAGSDSALAARSPGTRHRHYAPEARVVLVVDAADAIPGPRTGYIGLDTHPNAAHFGAYCHPVDVAAYAYELFAFFRRCDAAGITTLYALAVPGEGLGLALMDRLERAARR